MRFRARVEVWFDAGGLDRAQDAVTEMGSAVADRLGPTIRGPDRGLARTVLEPLDEEARAAFVAEDLGPGITSMLFEGGEPDSV